MSYPSATVPEMYYGPGRHDGAQRGFDMKWDTECSCARYTGQHEIP